MKPKKKNSDVFQISLSGKLWWRKNRLWKSQLNKGKYLSLSIVG